MRYPGKKLGGVPYPDKLQFTRLAFSFDVPSGFDNTLDGNMISRILSPGKPVIFMFGNDVPDIKPEKVAEALEVFRCPTRFVSEHEFLTAGDTRPPHWRISVPGIRCRVSKG